MTLLLVLTGVYLLCGLLFVCQLHAATTDIPVWYILWRLLGEFLVFLLLVVLWLPLTV